MNAEKKLTELKREDILEAALQEFLDNGFRATSMDRIAATAQVSKRTVYNHFQSKEVLFQVITQKLCDRIMQVSEHAYHSDIPLQTQLHAIAEQEMALLISDEFLNTLKMITAETLTSPELTKTNVDDFQESGIGVVKWIKEATKDGRLSVTDPVRAGKQFLALIEAFALWPQLYGYSTVPKKKEQQEIINSSVEMFLNTYAAGH
ncbi:MAG: TetR/AcrR family transcriptional regulator [Gammaproteobacteria bacterium]|nr:TetR/AcrR family transcriptional regulator [Gammaproteobacteria bacterium]